MTQFILIALTVAIVAVNGFFVAAEFALVTIRRTRVEQMLAEGRPGARNVQVRAPRGKQDVLADLEGRCDLVLVDAPCTGVGTWRRNPDAKWRIRPGALEQRMKDQEAVLERAAKYVKPGGRLVYVTCSLLLEENEDRIAAFLAAHPEFSSDDMIEATRAAGLEALSERADFGANGVTLRPSKIGADGFYICKLDLVPVQ